MAWILCLASHTLTLEPEKAAPDTVSCLCPCTTLCQRNWVSRGANTQSAGLGGGVGLGRVIFNPDHNNGLTHIMTPQGIGMKGNSLQWTPAQGWEWGAGARLRVQLLGTVLLPAHCVTSLSLHVLPSQVFFFNLYPCQEESGDSNSHHLNRIVQGHQPTSCWGKNSPQ